MRNEYIEKIQVLQNLDARKLIESAMNLWSLKEFERIETIQRRSDYVFYRAYT